MVKIGNGKCVVYNIGEEDLFFDTLVSSSEAVFMWRECVDVLGIANMMQMEIEVNVYNPVREEVEETQIYKPDPMFPWKNYDDNKPIGYKYEKMKLINYKNSHFNLIVGKDSALVSDINVVNDEDEEVEEFVHCAQGCPMDTVTNTSVIEENKTE